LFDLLLIYFGK